MKGWRERRDNQKDAEPGAETLESPGLVSHTAREKHEMACNALAYLRGDPVSMSWVPGQQLPVSHSDGGLDGRVPHWVRGRTGRVRWWQLTLVLEHHPPGPEVYLGFGLRQSGHREVLGFGPLVLELELKPRLPGLGTECCRL